MMLKKLRKPGFIGLIVALALMTAVMVVTAQMLVDPYQENLYYSDTGSETDGTTSLFQVELDTTSGHAVLTLLPGGLINFEHADVLAGTPDGATLFFIDSGPSQLAPSTLGRYDFATGLVQEIGLITLGGSELTGFDQAAFAPDGTLYTTSNPLDSLYSIDLVTAEATLVGPLVNDATSVVLNIGGGDIAFAADGTMYLWINLSRPGAPRGLYTITVPPAPGDVMATYVGEATDLDYFNGMAIRANGFGDIAASSFDDLIHIHGKDTGNDVGEAFEMYLNGSPFDSTGGDMSNGPRELCTRGYKYWSTSTWNGRAVTVVGVLVDEELGGEIFQNLNPANFSLLVGQMVAAKLNVNNSTGIAIIDDAEAWMADQGLVNPDGTLNYSKAFDSQEQLSTAIYHTRQLNGFNKTYRCRPALVFEK